MRNSVFDFALEVDRQISTLTREQFYLRTGRAKRLLEELYPLSRFALRLKYPGNDPEVEAFEDDGPLDGVVHWGGVPASQLKVEVTYVHSYQKALRDELLFSTGSTPGTGPIYRDKKTGNIVATSAVVPTAEEIAQLAAAIVERFRKKRAKPYPRGTALLIAFDDPTFWGSDLWGQLIASIKAQGGLEGGFEEVHIFNCGSNELQAF
jgi:hypothetical protein